MGEQELYQELSSKIGLPASERIQRLWKMICTEEEATVMLAMPGTLEELADKTGLALENLRPMVEELYRKGVVFERLKEGILLYRMSRDIIQFHDASILWPEAPPEFLLLWQEFMDNEYVELSKLMADMDIEPVTRVIPVEQAMEGGGSRVLPFESAASIVDGAERLAVTKCTCRLTAKKCASPLEVCLQLGRAADYAIKRGTGRELTKDEARAILEQSAEAGLVHVTDNRAGNGHIICNCCSCCCIVLPVIMRARKRVLLAPSRFLAEVDHDRCSLCQTCTELCPVQALTMVKKDGEERVEIEEDLCMGCGQCAYQCPEDCITMKEVRNPDFVPGAVA